MLMALVPSVDLTNPIAAHLIERVAGAMVHSAEEDTNLIDAIREEIQNVPRLATLRVPLQSLPVALTGGLSESSLDL